MLKMRLIPVAIFILLTPAFSITQLLIGEFFPNEKIALGLIILWLIAYNAKLSETAIVKATMLGFVIITIIWLRFVGGISPNITDFNHIYLCFAIIFYYTFFKKNIVQILRNLPIIVALNVAVSIWQNLFTFLGNYDVARLFNNYYSQTEYIYPQTFFGLFRTAGLFNESSQYATFLSFYLMLYLEKFVIKNRFSFFAFILSVIEVIISESITAYILLIMYFLIKSIGNNVRKISIRSLGLMSIVGGFLLFVGYDKISLTLSGEATTHPRLWAAINKITDTAQSNLLFGKGFHWENPTWDFISIYFGGFGIIGLTIVSFVLFWSLRHSISVLKYPFLLFLLSSGILLNSITIFMLFIVIILDKKQLYFTKSNFGYFRGKHKKHGLFQDSEYYVAPRV